LHRKPTNYVQSLARGLTILQAFSPERPALKLTELARITGLNATAVQRFTDTLLQLGFLHRSRQREFMLGPKVLKLSLAFLNGSQLKKLAEIHIAEFCETHRYTANLAVLDGDEIVFLYRHEAQRFLKYDLQAGSRLPSYCTASGKVLLAALTDGMLRSTLDRMQMEALTRYTIVDPQALWEDLVQTRRRGYSVSDRELSIALYSVGTPVLNSERRVIAALNLSLAADEVGSRREKALDHLKRLGRTLSSAMGYEGEYPKIADHQGALGES
jgi:IclR family pca regulon transcriptional regulator